MNIKQNRHRFVLGIVGAFAMGLLGVTSDAHQAPTQRKQDAQGRYLPVPTAGPAQKASFGMTSDVVLRVLEVRDGSTAAQLGLREGDLITRVDGKQFYSAQDVREMLSEKNPGDPVQVQFIRIDLASGKVQETVRSSNMQPRQN